jgi:hypothetical protein
LADARTLSCDPAICAGNPCTISGKYWLTPSCVLDFGAKDVSVAPGAILYAPTRGSVIVIRAKSLALRGTIDTGSATVKIDVSGDFTTLQSPGLGTILVSGTTRTNGTLEIVAGGDVAFAGRKVVVTGTGTSLKVTAEAITVDSELSADCRNDPGAILLTARSGSIRATKPVHANVRGVDGDGHVSLVAAGDIVLTGAVEANGGFGSSIDLAAGGNLTVAGDVSTNGGRAEYSFAGDARLTAGNDVTIAADVSARGRSVYAGNGGHVTIVPGPGGDVSIAGTIDVTTSNVLHGSHGDIVVGPACVVTLSGQLLSGIAGSPTVGSTTVSYRTSLDASAASLVSGSGGNDVLCRCVDANRNGVCEAGCVQLPLGLTASNVLPLASILPVPLDPCD